MIRNLLKAANALTLATAAILLLGGCSKNTIIIDGDWKPGQSNGGSSNPDDNTLVTFNAAVEGRNLFRSMTPMPKGIQNQVFAYQAASGNNTDGTPEAHGLYVTSSPGVLTGSDGYKMFLSNGVYNFYAVSDNFSRIPPVFTNGESEPLFNGIDYLWWTGTQQDVTSTQINIPIVYMHVATQVVFEVAGGEGITFNKLISATITPPEPGATMNLGTGVITPATAYGSIDKLGINGTIAQYIMLPLKNSQPMTLTLDVLVGNEPAPRIYTAQIPLPDGELSAGNSYLFKTVINENTVSFPSVYIKDWTEVDETGKPIYPVQK